MGLWRRDRAPANRMTSEQLADYGRFEFLKEQSDIEATAAFALIAPLNELLYGQDAGERVQLIAELGRHSQSGEWERVGAWKYVRGWLDDEPGTQDLIDAGLLALHRMQVTNLQVHLAPIDTPRYEELTGGPVPHDGFFGPPVFATAYGPTRQYYLDSAVTAAARVPRRLTSAPGVEPVSIDDAARSMWDFGMLIHRGPLVVNPDIAYEPSVVKPAAEAATDVDHGRFAELIVERVTDDSTYLYGVWSALGAARFIEEYLDPATVETPAYQKALDAGLGLALRGPTADLETTIAVLTPRARTRLRELQKQAR